MDEAEATGEVNALLDEARIPQAVKGAAIAVAGSGLVVALMGLQNMIVVRWLGAWFLVPLSLLLVGAAGIAVGAKLVRARRWSLKAGLVASAALMLASLAFLVVGALAGVFTLFSLLGFGGGVTALVLSILAVKPFQRLMVTRQKLRRAGFDLDL